MGEREPQRQQPQSQEFPSFKLGKTQHDTFGEGLRLTTGDTCIDLYRHGEEVVIFLAPHLSPEAPQPEQVPSPLKENLPAAETEQRRVELAGRLGDAPVYRTTATGKLVARFPVAVPVEGQEKPKWHQVIMFGDRAEKLRGKFKKGDSVEVGGYIHEREEIDKRDGSVKIREEIYGFYVRAPKPK